MLDDVHERSATEDLPTPTRLTLPARPAELAAAGVAAWREPVTLRTYSPAPPSVYPAYLDRRVYQGSSGRVYPLPFHDRIESEPRDVAWDGVHLENRWIRVLVLPQLGGRIHVARERSTGEDFFYGNPVIKPALVGLAGPWIAGGVELNWPQHHRPATFLPVDVEVEHEPDGAVTVWCSDHDPFERMKGMHGIRMRPDSSTIELRVRLYNRTPMVQTFLWWSNVAARTHRDYQSFFPTDVDVVADHAKRAVCGFPVADRPYYGIDYPARHDEVMSAADGSTVRGDRLDWPSNIPVPTSYMVLRSDHDFFGGYDHAAQIGFVHVADRRVAPGKKQWTWGDAPFGRAWCRNLADDDSQYIELMAGAFTDNQPDFAYLAPGETKVFSQHWYPLIGVGPVHEASTEAAVRVHHGPHGVSIGVATTRERRGLRVQLRGVDGAVLAERGADVDPAAPLRWQVALPPGVALGRVEVSHDGAALVTFDAVTAGGLADVGETAPAQEPPAPADVPDVDQLLAVAEHLVQYRHANCSPEPYWTEALRREPDNSQANLAVGVHRLRHGRLTEAEEHLRRAAARQTALHPTPSDGASLYHLGLALAWTGRDDQAYEHLARAAWDRAWRAPAGYELARIDAAAGREHAALHRLADVLRAEPEHLQARTLRAIVLQRLGRAAEAEAELSTTSAIDPLHWWTRTATGEEPACDAQTLVDLALEQAAVGETASCLRLLELAEDRDADRAVGQTAVGPLAALHRAAVLHRTGDWSGARTALADAATRDRRWAFPGRLQDGLVLTELATHFPDQPLVHTLLGTWLYGVGRHDDALRHWQHAVALGDDDPVLHRNIGLALGAVRGDLDGARRAYDRAIALAPEDAQLLHESDVLDTRRGISARQRLARLTARRDLVAQRDDLTVELAHLLVDDGRAGEALELLTGRRFQPWEGGEGQTLRAWERASAAMAEQALARGELRAARKLVDDALRPPANLGEDRHPLASTARLHLLRGDIAAAGGDRDSAVASWTAAADSVGDFVAMAVDEVGDAAAFAVRALRRLGRDDDARALTDRLAERAATLAGTPAVIDYFATSLPQLLLFPPDLADERRSDAAALTAVVAGLRTEEVRGGVPGAERRPT